MSKKCSKSKFCQSEIKYLGYIVGQGCLKVDHSKVSAIVDFPLPKSPRQLRRFVGMANWYRSFISHFATIATSLTDSSRKSKVPFYLSPEAKQSFLVLKEALACAPVLAQPDFSKEFIVQCDASRVGVGGVLYQVDEQGRDRPISFVSQKLNNHQRWSLHLQGYDFKIEHRKGSLNTVPDALSRLDVDECVDTPPSLKLT